MSMQKQQTIEAENGREYPADIYEETTKAVGTQQWVANQWMQGKLPTHNTSGSACFLRSSTGNFRGRQYPDGHGELWHYRTVEAWRTLNQTFISNTECYSRGWAHCSTPHRKYVKEYNSLPLSTLRARSKRHDRLPGISHIVDVIRGDGEYRGYDRLVIYDEAGVNILAAHDKVQTDVLISESEVDAVLKELDA